MGNIAVGLAKQHGDCHDNCRIYYMCDLRITSTKEMKPR